MKDLNLLHCFALIACWLFPSIGSSQVALVSTQAEFRERMLALEQRTDKRVLQERGRLMVNLAKLEEQSALLDSRSVTEEIQKLIRAIYLGESLQSLSASQNKAAETLLQTCFRAVCRLEGDRWLEEQRIRRAHLANLRTYRARLVADGRESELEHVDSEIMRMEAWLASWPNAPESQVLFPVADATVQRVHGNGNFGLSETLLAKKDGSPLDRQAFLRFDLREVTSPVHRARVRLIATNNQPGSPQTLVSHLPNDSWDELQITWKSRLSGNEPFLALDSPPNGQAVEFNVTDLVLQELESDGQLSLQLGAGHSHTPVGYASSEHAQTQLRPVLILNDWE